MRHLVSEARIFTKVDVCGAYYLIWIMKRNEYNTAFRTRYRQFVYQVMTFGLSNALATSQAYIDDCLWPYIDDFGVCYLHDILIYSANEKEHEDHVHLVLQRLNEFGLYCNAEMCQFGVSEVGLPGFVITPAGVDVELDRISTIEDWPTPKSVRDVQALFGYTTLYQRFIQRYCKVNLPLMELLKKSEISRGKKSEGSAKWEWTPEFKLVFRKLKRTITEATIMQDLDPAKLSILETDATGFAIAAILNQYDVFVGTDLGVGITWVDLGLRGGAACTLVLEYVSI
jgi:hypothetical protein